MNQAPLQFSARGGFRAGAGRKPDPESGVSHLARPALVSRHPVHATLRVVRGCWNLRSHRALVALESAFRGGRDRFGFRLVHYVILGNHLHLIVEAADKLSLSRAMKGLCVRIARALNRMMGRKGKVFADRYHSHVLKSRREVARALRYVLCNYERHAREWGETFRLPFIDPFSSVRYLAADVPAGAPTAPAATWLLRVGWLGAA